MNLTAEQIQENWEKLMSMIDQFITSPRKDNLVAFYEKYQDRLMMMPASHKKEYHNAFPGGYVDHVVRVMECAVRLHKVWDDMGADTSTYTFEELIFSALNHDLGKLGDENQDAYIPQTDQWRRDKLGEDYMFNNTIPFASVPDRSLFFLHSNNIQYTFNEMVAIQTHDGLYDEGNKKYLMGYLPEQKPRTALPFILHQADLMAARIEFEKEWLPKFQGKNLEESKKNFTLGGNKPNGKTQSAQKSKALGSIKSEGLKNLLNNI
jgi:hypothetical protein